MHIFKTKFQPRDKVMWNGQNGVIDEVHIFYPSGEDMGHWRKTLPQLDNGEYQYTSYTVIIGGELHDIAESGLISME